jgi:hypothetical protein
MNVADALEVANLDCHSGILNRRALVSLAREVWRLRKIVEAAGEDSTPPGEAEELEESATA